MSGIKAARARYDGYMRVTTGRVVDGKIVVEGEPLPEGATVTVLAPQDDRGLELGPERGAGLREAMKQLRRGEFVDGDELLDELDLDDQRGPSGS